MKETAFIKQNKEKWEKFERLIKQEKKDPDEVSELFTEITDDFSYARTFYSKRSVRVYLNYLAQQVFNNLYKKRREKFSKFTHFWSHSLPITMFQIRRDLLLAFVIFAISIGIGMISSHFDDEFMRVTIGQGYVEMTKENIANEDPMAVYKGGRQIDSFMGIAWNNLRVALMAFVLGIIFGVGAVYILVYNGIMVGSFQYFFIQRDLGLESFLTIWIHGALEISCIVIAGAAGITLGRGLLFPGTYTRMQSLQMAAKRGLKIMVGIAPIIAFAAFLEGFITRLTEMPMIFKWVIIILSFVFIVGYFVVYPFLRAWRMGRDAILEETASFEQFSPIEFFRIRDVGEVFNDTFGFYRSEFRNFGKVLGLVLILNAVALCLIYALNPQDMAYDLGVIEMLGAAFGMGDHFNPAVAAGHALLFALMICAVYYCFTIYNQEQLGFWKGFLHFWWRNFFKVLPVVLIVYAALAWQPLITVFLLIPLAPFIIVPFFTTSWEKLGFFKGLSRGLSFGGVGWAGHVALYLVLLLICAVFSFILFSPVYAMLVEQVVEWHTVTVFENYQLILNLVAAVVATSFLYLILPLMFIGFAFQYFSQREKEEAIGLYERLKTFGAKHRIYEVEGEGDF